jgi:hypothetical protein
MTGLFHPVSAFFALVLVVVTMTAFAERMDPCILIYFGGLNQQGIKISPSSIDRKRALRGPFWLQTSPVFLVG